MNLILTGLRGTGKSTIGKLLSEKMNRPFIDLDKQIEHSANKKIVQILQEHGWDYFRDLEHEATKEVAKLDNQVIATGGGTLIFERNSQLLKKNALVILLTCDLEIAAERITNDPNRPPLTSQKTILEELRQLWQEREKTYLQVADKVIDTTIDPPEETTDKIILLWKIQA